MGQRMNKNKWLYTILFMCVFGVALGATAWAAAQFMDQSSTTDWLEKKKYDLLNASLFSFQSITAPEPTTLALFGSGLFGILISFVRQTYLASKRLLDIATALAGFLILSPLLILTAILVRISSKGPILYSQIRVGRYGRHFRIFKFRTMVADAEKASGPMWAQKNDSRLTPVGHFLRKAHLDELPQLYNILIGDMSLIGPRPERPVFVEKFKKVVPDYEKRLAVKPGLTGLAQVWHRYDETIADVRKKVRYDLLYIKRMCVWTDINIILRTFRVVLTGEGAR